VLSVNYRGSTGFGKAFVTAADHEWGGSMHDDLIDALDRAVTNGIGASSWKRILPSTTGR
jgi:dipeptidyl aminopeptidase/acylaminoacyl peptidase